jgi:hypothetical protein
MILLLTNIRSILTLRPHQSLPGSLDVPEEEIAPHRNSEQTYRRFVNYITTIINNNPRVDTASKRNSLLIPLSKDIENGQYGPNEVIFYIYIAFINIGVIQLKV